MGDRWLDDLYALMDDVHDPTARPEEDWRDPSVGTVVRPLGSNHPPLGRSNIAESGDQPQVTSHNLAMRLGRMNLGLKSRTPGLKGLFGGGLPSGEGTTLPPEQHLTREPTFRPGPRQAPPPRDIPEPFEIDWTTAPPINPGETYEQWWDRVGRDRKEGTTSARGQP